MALTKEQLKDKGIKIGYGLPLPDNKMEVEVNGVKIHITAVNNPKVGVNVVYSAHEVK